MPTQPNSAEQEHTLPPPPYSSLPIETPSTNNTISSFAETPFTPAPEFTPLTPLSSLLHQVKPVVLSSYSDTSAMLSQVDAEINKHLELVNSAIPFPIFTRPNMKVEMDRHMIPLIHGNEQKRGTWKYKQTGITNQPGVLRKLSDFFK